MLVRPFFGAAPLRPQHRRSPCSKLETFHEKSPNHTLKGVLFDWDGTLLNSYAADTPAYLAMFAEMQNSLGVAELEQHYSPNWYNVYRAANLPRDKYQAADLVWRQHYARHRPKLLPGARRVSANLLASMPWVWSPAATAIASTANSTNSNSGITSPPAFAAMIPAYANRIPPRCASPFRLLSLRAKDCVYVGDSPEDLQMARSAGVRAAIAILGPFPTEKRLRAAKPDLFLESISETPAALRQCRD